jgi:hypothetical protein
MWGAPPIQRPWPHQLDPDLAERMGWDNLGKVPVTAASLRLPLARMLEEWMVPQRGILRAAKGLGDAPEAVDTAIALLPARRGRARLSTELLDRVEEPYSEALAEGRRDPANVVCSRLGKEQKQKLNRSTVRSRIRAARRRARDAGA